MKRALLCSLLLAGCGSHVTATPRDGLLGDPVHVDASGRVSVTMRDAAGGRWQGRGVSGALHGTARLVNSNATYTYRVGDRQALVRRAYPAPVSRPFPHGTLFLPPAGRTGTPVLLLGGSEGGVNPANTITAQLLAMHGHPTILLAYFRAPGLPGALRRIPLEFFLPALRRLGPGVVVMGWSRGGELALLLGATYPQLVGGVIGMVPSDRVHAAPDRHSVAWTEGGRPVPRGPIDVSRIRGPVLAVGGAADSIWPSAAYVRDLKDRLPRAQALVFPGAGHLIGFPVPYVAAGRFGGGDPDADERARITLWPRILRFLG